jgi:hypothetical protein
MNFTRERIAITTGRTLGHNRREPPEEDMIQVSVVPGQLVAGQRSRLDIRFVNTGTSGCTDIVFKLGLPSGIALVSGKERIEIERLRPGGSHVQGLIVEPAGAGEFALTSPNFSYRDCDDERIRVSGWQQPLSVEAARPVQQRAARPVPRLHAEYDGAELAFEEWNVLPVLVRNSTGVPVSDVSVTLLGPIETNGKRGRVTTLPDGQVARISFSVKASDRGLVPVCVRMAYSYPDELGSLRPWSQEEQINVTVTKRAEQAAADPGAPERGRAGMDAGIRKLCVAFDVENYSGRGTRGEYAVQKRLFEILEVAFQEAGVPPESLEMQEQGDGGIAFVATGGRVDEPRLIVGLINSLGTRLTELNEDLVESARVRLRVGLHEGVVHRAALGYVGPAVIEVCRLRDADEVRAALAGSDAPMVAVVADALYRDVLSQSYHGLRASDFTEADVKVKSYTGKAWIYLPRVARAASAAGRSRDVGRARPASGVETILYLTASPRDMDPLRSDLEMRKVQEKLQLGRDRDAYRLEYRGASRLDDMSQALFDYEPRVVHFSGHGDIAGGLYVENEMGFSTLTNPDGLAKMFGQHRDTIQCVIVNACHSARLAEAMARHIDYAIGMRWEVGDASAIQFSVGFYQALFAGWSVPDAFERGCAMVESNSATEADSQTPVLFPPG